jgi:membrane protein required for colicin V production
VRGATREVTTVIALILAAVVSVFALRITGPAARHFVATPWMANVAALLVVFVLVYVVLRLIGGMLTRGVQRTVLSGLDRALGGAIGLVRGLIAIGAFVLLIDAATPPERIPTWITGAKLFPLADASASLLRVFAPQGWKLANEVAPTMTHAVLDGASPPAHAPPPNAPNKRDAGYSAMQRNALDVLVEKSR